MNLTSSARSLDRQFPRIALSRTCPNGTKLCFISLSSFLNISQAPIKDCGPTRASYLEDSFSRNADWCVCSPRPPVQPHKKRGRPIRTASSAQLQPKREFARMKVGTWSLVEEVRPCSTKISDRGRASAKAGSEKSLTPPRWAEV